MSSTAERIATARRAGNVTLTALTVPAPAHPADGAAARSPLYLCVRWSEGESELSTARAVALTADGFELVDTTRMLAALRPLMRTRDHVSAILDASGPDVADLRTIHALPHRDLRAVALQLYTTNPTLPIDDIVAAAHAATDRTPAVAA